MEFRAIHYFYKKNKKSGWINLWLKLLWVLRCLFVLVRSRKDLFHKNFSCSCKAYNELLGKYNKLFKKDNTLKPTYPFLSKLLNEIKRIALSRDVESTCLHQSARDLATGFSSFFKNPDYFNRPVFHKKRKTRPSFRQTIPTNKKIINDNILTLRVYGDVEFKTSKEYLELLNKK